MDEYLLDDDIKFLLMTEKQAKEKLQNRQNKFMLHLIRLMYEGIELLNDCTLTLPGFYNKELLDIGRGIIEYSAVLARYEDLKKQMEYAYLKTELPHAPNINKLNDLLVELVEEHWRQKNGNARKLDR